MDIQKIIGENLKSFRQKKQITLSELAERSGLSKGMLSQIEKGETNPTINTIWKLSAGLDISYTTLLEPPKKAVPRVLTKKETLMQMSDDHLYRVYSYFVARPDRSFEIFEMELEEGASHLSIGHSKSADEYIIVLDGKLSIEVASTTHILQQEDALLFHAEGEHRYTNIGQERVRAVMILHYVEN